MNIHRDEVEVTIHGSMITEPKANNCFSINFLTKRNKISKCQFTNSEIKLFLAGRPLRPDIVHFHSACLGSEIFLRELTTIKHAEFKSESSRSVDPQFSHKMLFYLHSFHDKFFHFSTTRIDDNTRLCHTKRPISINQSSF